MSQWATERGIVMNDKLQWKQYDANDDANWGLELTEPVPAGSILLQVPHDLVLRADDTLYDEFVSTYGKEKVDRALEKLDEYRVHKETFLIVLKLFRQCKRGQDSQWAPWIQAMPQSFPEFTTAERECLPMYAKAAADYQDQKFKAFCAAAKELDEWDDEDAQSTEMLKWAFHMVSSRCWKTEPPSKTNDDGNTATSTTELVPIGDMFNHREPPNVAIVHGPDSVNFVYKGNTNNEDNDDSRALFISYGSSYNPHRFLVVFGFCPEEGSMPEVWSHLHFPNNPFCTDASKMVFGTANGDIPTNVWDAVLYALLDGQSGMLPLDNPKYTREEMHAKYKKHTTTVLQNHISQNLQQLHELKQKMMETLSSSSNKDDDAAGSPNLNLIRQHNDLLTTVFSRVQTQLQDDKGI